MSSVLLGVVPDFAELSNVDDPLNKIGEKFYSTAGKIMLGHDLVCGDRCLQITALELYIFHPEMWPDDSTDRDKEGVQSELGKWYVKKTRFRTQWRIDITAGVGVKGIYAGMLIAAVGKEDGSANALYTIIHGAENKRDWQKYNEKEILKIHNTSVFAESSYLRLEIRNEARPGKLWIGKRKGLDSWQKLQDRFKNALLRVAVGPPCEDWKSHKELQMRPLNS